MDIMIYLQLSVTNFEYENTFVVEFKVNIMEL